MKIAIVVITLSVLVVFFLTAFLIKGFQKTYSNAKKKFSDKQLLELLVEEGNVLSVRQLATLSPLTRTEVSIRVSTWMNNGAVRQLSSNDGMILYQLKHKMPDASKSYDIKQYDDREALDLVLKNIKGVEISVAHFVWVFDITIQEARKLMKRLIASQLVQSHFTNGFQRVYVANVNAHEFKNRDEKIAIPKIEDNDDGRIPINDSDILKLAIDHKGRLTPTVICIEKQISLDDAQDLLDGLYEKGAFHIEVDDNSGTIEYWLRDSKLYK